MSRIRKFFVTLVVLTGLYVLSVLFAENRVTFYGGGSKQSLTEKTVNQREVDYQYAPDSPNTHNAIFRRFCGELWNSDAMVKKDLGTKSPKRGCSCGEEAFGPFNNASLNRRIKEFREWKKHQNLEKEPVVYNEALSPLGYPAGGVTVEPGETIPITPLYLHPIAVECLHYGMLGKNHPGNKLEIKFTCSRELGTVFMSLHPHQLSVSTEVFGNDTHILRICLYNYTAASHTATSEEDIDFINALLSHIHYRSVHYDILKRDVIKMRVENFTSEINILIKRSTMPVLYDTEPDDDIASKVTIVTKTFERPPCVLNLVKSIRKYYPNVTIVIADDSENVTRIQGYNIKHYIMPFAEGWFAGRNLALSQVPTKYFLWVDDDFEFTERTDLQKFVEKLEDEEEQLDIVAGAFENRRGKTIINTNTFKTMTVLQGDENGSCLIRNRGYHRKMKNYPQCIRSDVVINFFMAKTLSARRIGFDPEYMRIGHTEFFTDGLGQLSIALCFDVTVKHTRYKPEKYLFYRRQRSDPDDPHNIVQHTLFKNNLQCFEFH